MGETELRHLLADAADRSGPLGRSPEGVLRAVRRRRRRRTAVGGLTAAAFVVGAVLVVHPGADRSAPDTGAPTVATTSRPGCGTDPGPATTAPGPVPGRTARRADACRFLGLTLEAARAEATAEQWYVVVRSLDGVNFGITYVYDPSRLVVDVVHDRIVAADFG
ncbi:hypothetical protein [Kitasatospora phosalacinea]|uniref:PepSY domain-containing protein n=1 Tax=Kitasatospora phosalacinea TaxID=2065 RepID=A0ABW6GLL2_9ACTN